MTGSRDDKRLQWQSKAVLLIVLPWTMTSVLLQTQWWMAHEMSVVWQALGISAIFGLIVWRMRAATPGGALTGAAITANLIFASAQYPYQWTWLHGLLMPLFAVFLLTYVATKIGRSKKVQLGTAENKRGRNAAQVAANLGIASLAASFPYGALRPAHGVMPLLAEFTLFASLAALAEAAADTVSSEIGQVLGGRPRMITNLRRVDAGTDGAITLAGTLAGVAAAIIVAGIFVLCIFIGPHCGPGVSGCDVVVSGPTDRLLTIAFAAGGGVFGLLFDSLLGATFERAGWLNNDAVNFVSTLAAAALSVATIFTLVAIFLRV